MKKERIDKLIAGSGKLSRKDVIGLISHGDVEVNGKTVKSGSEKVDAETDEIRVRGEIFTIKKHIYIMLNKPKGVVSASDGKGEKTVCDLVPEELMRRGLFPAGRLDKDTTGFVLITDDGEFAHRILSPKNHIDKNYVVSLRDNIEDEAVSVLENGITLRDGTTFLPSKIKILSDKECEITICEGKYHQIKRMFCAVGNKVVDLRRIKMGGLFLDEKLKDGECREITADELTLITEK